MKKYFILAAAALAMVACTNDENENAVQDDNVIRLSACVAGMDGTRAGSNLLQTAFAVDDRVCVLLEDPNGTTTYSWNNYIVGAGGALTGSPVQYYPIVGGQVTARAYYPAGVSTTEGEFAVALEQGAPSGIYNGDLAYTASDLMYATIETPFSKTSNDAARTLTFHHLLSKISVTLAAGSGVTASDLSAATVKLKDVVYKGTFAPATGTFTAASASTADNKSDIIITTAAGTTQHSAIVVPQDMSGKLLEVTIGGVSKTWAIAASTTFAADTHYAFTVTVSATGITAIAAIHPWTPWTPTGSEDQGSVLY